MKRSTNFINNVLTMAITLGLVFLAVVLCNERYYNPSAVKSVSLLVVGAILAGFISTLAHEMGHIIVGKKNGFVFLSVSVWFFKWTKIKNSLRFDFVMLSDAGGYSEMVSENLDGIETRFKKMTMGGLIFTFIVMLIGLVAVCIPSLPLWAYCLTVMFLPMGAYCFFGNALPMVNGGARNDGGVLTGLRRKDDESRVILSLISIQSELYNGKTPSEIDEKLYFDLPQLPEDNLNFIMLLDSRYCYYLDKKDYENAKKTTERLLGLEDYMPKQFVCEVKANALYNACTFDFNAEIADGLTYEIEKYLNNVNTPLNVRAKTAYILFVQGEKENLDIFYKKGLKEAKKCQLKGLGRYETKLLDGLKEKFSETEE